MRVNVRALLFNSENRCLMVQHHERNPADLGKWATVGGGLEGSEDHRSGLLRELEEEFGAELVSRIDIGPSLFSHQLPDRLDHFYVVRFSGFDVSPKAADEIIQHRWFEVSELPALSTFFGFEARLFEKAAEIL